jgi:hypothetical protein
MCSVKGLKLLAVLLLLVGTLLIVDGLKELDLLLIVGSGVGMIFHDVLDGVWLLKGRLMLGILKSESL